MDADRITPEIRQLVDAACAGTLDAAQQQRLDQQIAADEQVARYYARCLDLHAELYFLAGIRRGRQGAQVQVSGPRSERAVDSAAVEAGLPRITPKPWHALPAGRQYWQRHPVSFLAMVSALTLLLGAGFLVIWGGPFAAPGIVQVPPHPKDSQVIARLTDGLDPVWEEESDVTFRQSDLLSGGAVLLKEGLAELTFDGGAVVLLKGPARFTVDQAGAGTLEHGTLRAWVGQRARGFIVKTPVATVTDLGTEFGVSVGQPGGAEIHVFEGKVNVDSQRLNKQFILLAGQAIRLGADNLTASRTAANIQRFPQKIAHDPPETYTRWKAYSDQLRNDPDLVAYYTFERDPTSATRLRNHAGSGNELHGDIQGAQWVAGRWPHKTALFFGGPQSGHLVDLGEASATRCNFEGPFTIASWFRIRSLSRDWQAIASKGDSAWRVHFDGDKRLSFGSNHADIKGSDLVSETNLLDGRWHLAVTVFARTASGFEKRLYLDGRLEATEARAEPVKANDHNVWIGDNTEQPGRVFHGRIGEQMLLSRAMTDSQVRALHEAGSPYVPATPPAPAETAAAEERSED